MRTLLSDLWALLSAAILAVILAPGAAAGDPPYRVARLNYASGSVSLQPAGVDDWTTANINRPLTTGDRLWTDNDARAELHIGTTALRLSGQTSMSFLNLDDHTVQIQLNQGSLSFRVRTLPDQETFEVDTPNLAFTVLRPGEYRLDADPNGQATIVVARSGEGEATGGGQAFTVHAFQQARVTGQGSPLSYDLTSAPAFDGFDNWSQSRDVREDRALAPRYVSRDVIGYEDLDDYGRWTVTPAYGPVWTPLGLAPGWAPYRFGHWAWIAPWGWTWVDDTPWGFAPFHYGRWAWIGNGWAWVPGPVVVRPVYSPALVAFVGGPHFGVSLAFGGGGGVGWFPLAPGEPYVPAYRASPAYIGSVNNTTINNTTINSITVNNYHYANQTVPGAVTAVPTQAFVSAKPVAASAVTVPPSAAQAAQVVPAAPVAPVKTSVLGPGANAASVPTPPASVMNRPVVAKTPPPPAPVPFVKQQQALTARPGHPLEPEVVQRMQPAAAQPLAKIAPSASPAASKAPATASPATPNTSVPKPGAPAKPAETTTRTPSSTTSPAPSKPSTSSTAPPSSKPPTASTPQPSSSKPPSPPPKPPTTSQTSHPPAEPKPPRPSKEQEKEKEQQKPSEPKPPLA